MGRPNGLLLGLDLSFNPFSLRQSYKAIAHLPLIQRVLEMRKQDVREKILSEGVANPNYYALNFVKRYDRMFVSGDPPCYDPPLDQSIMARAERLFVTPEEIVYDLLLEKEGRNILFLPIGNYAEGNIDAVYAMLSDNNIVYGVGDGGAHYGVICDAGYPTYMLTYWARDRKLLKMQQVVKALCRDTALAVGLEDRGLIAPGYKADMNIIDYGRLHLHAPRPVFDLPGNGRRLQQAADGYVATIVRLKYTYSHYTGGPIFR